MKFSLQINLCYTIRILQTIIFKKMLKSLDAVEEVLGKAWTLQFFKWLSETIAACYCLNRFTKNNEATSPIVWNIWSNAHLDPDGNSRKLSYSTFTSYLIFINWKKISHLPSQISNWRKYLNNWCFQPRHFNFFNGFFKT